MLKTMQTIVRSPFLGVSNCFRSTGSFLGSRFLSSGGKDDSDSKKIKSDVNYDPYPDYQTQSPYMDKATVRRFYQYKFYTGGVLPRPEGEWENKPQPLPTWSPAAKDKWTSKKALFGQNDYIDILGDGTIHPWELIKAPAWLKGFKGNEIQRLTRQLGVQGRYLQDSRPTMHHKIKKQVRYLWKKLNVRKQLRSFGGYRRYSRIDKPVL